jgi:hypothetical protein
LQYWGRSNTHQQRFAVGLRFGQKFFNVTFCSYLHLQYFNWAAVSGGRISNPPTSQSPIVVRNPKLKSNNKINMKTKQIFIPLIAIFIFTLTACKKDTITDPDPTPNATLSADSNYLSKILFIEKYGSILDTFVRAFTYDNLKRVTLVQDYTLNPTAYEELTNYFYNGLDSLPFKTIIIDIQQGGNLKDTVLEYFTYNTNGFLVNDSSIAYRHIPTNNQPFYEIQRVVTKYNYSLNKIYGNTDSRILYNLSGSLNSSTMKDTFTLDANRDVLTIKSRQVYIGTNTTIYGFIGSYTYDTKPSHCKAQNINNIFPIRYRIDAIYNQQGAKTTRVKSIEEDYTNGNLFSTNTSDYTNKYTFKANGFPASALMPYPPSTDYSKLVFIYTTL